MKARATGEKDFMVKGVMNIECILQLWKTEKGHE